MPTKTDRILSYLPHTFLTVPRPKVLYPVADAFGNELLRGENSLAEIMLSHWVDHADKNAEQIDDLERLAALYALAPQRDQDGNDLESVEEFREHLKHYVRTFLEGTVTVQGIMRISAEALGLRLADETVDIDRWWTRKNDAVTTIETNPDDASGLLRFERKHVTGAPARPAEVTGNIDLAGGIEVTGPAILRLKVDSDTRTEIDFAKGRTLPIHLTPGDIVKTINDLFPSPIARHDGHHLTLVSPETGLTSRIEVLGGANDITPRLLGLASRSYRGANKTGARLVGSVDLSQGVNLSAARFMRIEVDGKHVVEVDCAGNNPANRSLDDIIKAINLAFGFTVASAGGKNLVLTSPTKGFQSSIAIQPPAAQNAAVNILGVASAFETGRDDQPASVTSTRDLRGGVDLSERANLRLSIDGEPALTINCAGVDPAKTQRIEIVAAINAALKDQVANVTERGISLTSPTKGDTSQIVFETAPIGDAALDIFGIAPLNFVGGDATRARLIAKPNLTKAGGINPWAQELLSLAIDGAPPVEINLRDAAKPFEKIDGVSTEDFVEVHESISLDDLAAFINEVLQAQIVATDGERLLFTSPTTGGASSLEVKSLETTSRRRFVSRAIVIDEATPAVFGFNGKEATGEAATKARITGTRDLSQADDLSRARLLRLAIDNFPATEIDCAGPRARATTLDEIVESINTGLKAAGLPEDVASHDGKHLVLVSPSAGAESKIAIQPPLAALEKLLGIEPETFRGRDDTQVKFTATVDLSPGIDLDPNAAIKLGFDDKAPVEISLAGPAPNHQSILDITTKINTALQAVVAGSDGKHIVLTSPQRGTPSKLVFAAPTGRDVTKQIFGIGPPRTYQGEPGAPARITAKREHTGPIDLRGQRFLSLAIDGGPIHDVDCASRAAQPAAATLAEVVTSINAELRQIGLTKDVASEDGKRLILTSPTTGTSSELKVAAYDKGNAKEILFGDVASEATGSAAVPASITGGRTVLAPANLARRSLLRVAVDGGRARDIDVAGTIPGKTFLDEIVNKINAVFPNLASATDDDKLKLTSPTPGETSAVSVSPLRFLEVSEYTPADAVPVTMSARHGDSKKLLNPGAADAFTEFKITAPQGAVGPTIVNEAVGWSIRLFKVIETGESVSLRRSEEGELIAEIISTQGKRTRVDGSRILVGPLGAQTPVPFYGNWELVDDSLQLNNPDVPVIVVLRAVQPESAIEVGVVEADLKQLSPAPEPEGRVVSLRGRLSEQDGEFVLVDADEKLIASLRAGSRANLKTYVDQVVKVRGPFHAQTPPLMIAQTISRLFDVTITSAGKSEAYPQVTIGTGSKDEDDLMRQISVGAKQVKPSALVTAVELSKSTVLSLRRGTTSFRYLDCLGSRFGKAVFDHARFPDGICGERGIFGVSRFTNVPPERVNAVFASSDPFSDPPVQIEFRWVVHQPGTFVVNLPSDLPARFGARFGEARFSQEKDKPEMFAGAVAEPISDTRFVATLIKDNSNFVTAEKVNNVDLGWAPVEMPFRKPQFLTLGNPNQAARLYLSEPGLSGFIMLQAKQKGTWGNAIAVAARQAGPAIYDVSVIYLGGRFESARALVLGQPIADLASALLKPGPVGVLMAKAAGVKAGVTRDRAEYKQSITSLQKF